MEIMRRLDTTSSMNRVLLFLIDVIDNNAYGHSSNNITSPIVHT